MSDPVQIALITAATAMIASLPATIIAIMNGIRSRERADQTSKKADTIIEKATEIHALTNSQLATVTAALNLANSKIEGLQTLIASMQAAQIAALAVQQQAERSSKP